MSEFDPYLKWLGIRDAERPPNHYRLLGLTTFENDPDVIDSAADRQMSHVRTFQLGPQGDLSQKLLNEISRARLCLLTPADKAAYDRNLAASGVVADEPVATTPENNFDFEGIGGFDGIGAETSSSPSPFIQNRNGGRPNVRRKSNNSRVLISLFAWVSGALAAVGVAYLIIESGFLDRFRKQHPTKIVIENEVERPDKVVKRDDDKPDHSESDPSKIAKKDNKSADDKKVKIVEPEPVALIAPWDEKRWPDAPEYLTRPKNKLDRALQATRRSLSQRNFTKARQLWNSVKPKIQKDNPDVNFGDDITKSQRFWGEVGKQIKSVRVGDELIFRGRTVSVAKKKLGSLSLNWEDEQKAFTTSLSKLDRDLAAALMARNRKYDQEKIDDVLDLDFAHITLSDTTEFFEVPTLETPVEAETKMADTGASDADPENLVSKIQPDPGRAKIQPPNKTDVEASLRMIKNIYPRVYNRSTNRAEKLNILADMFRSGIESKNVANQFALLSETARIASENGDYTTTLNSLSELNQRFLVDYYDLIVERSKTVARKLNSAPERSNFAESLLEIATEAQGAGDTDNCEKIASAVISISQSLENPSLKKHATTVRDNARFLQKIVNNKAKAEKTLEKDNANKQAHSDLGAYHFFVSGKINKGCDHWLKSGKNNQVKLATLEKKAAKNKEFEVCKELAEAWMAFGKPRKTLVHKKACERALNWFDVILVELQGLERRQLEKRMQELDSYVNGSSAGGKVGRNQTPDLESIKLLFTGRWVISTRRVNNGGGQLKTGLDTQRLFADFSPNRTVVITVDGKAQTLSWELANGPGGLTDVVINFDRERKVIFRLGGNGLGGRGLYYEEYGVLGPGLPPSVIRVGNGVQR